MSARFSQWSQTLRKSSYSSDWASSTNNSSDPAKCTPARGWLANLASNAVWASPIRPAWYSSAHRLWARTSSVMSRWMRAWALDHRADAFTQPRDSLVSIHRIATRSVSPIDDLGQHSVGATPGDLHQLQHDRQLPGRQPVKAQLPGSDQGHDRVGGHGDAADLDGDAGLGEHQTLRSRWTSRPCEPVNQTGVTYQTHARTVSGDLAKC